MSRNICILVALALMSSASMAKDIFIHSHNMASGRYAIFEDNEQVAYLYLTQPGTQKPARDAIAYSRVPLIAKVDWEQVKKTGEPPSLSQDIASPSAVLKNPLEREFSLQWSTDGQAVALLRNGEPIAFVSAADSFGYSKAAVKPSPLVNPWDQNRYEALFGKKP
jgi:hypothetical protein